MAEPQEVVKVLSNSWYKSAILYLRAAKAEQELDHPDVAESSKRAAIQYLKLAGSKDPQTEAEKILAGISVDEALEEYFAGEV